MGSDQSINDGKSLQSVNKGSDLSFLIVKKKIIPRRDSLPNLLLTVSLIVMCFTVQDKLVKANITYFLDSNYGSMVHLTTEHIFNM